MLIDAATNEAKRMGFRRLYLYTFHKHHREFYEKLGWRMLERARYRKRGVLVFVRQIQTTKSNL
jgi:N-acetylglutamate synthase-like GNAT family acetyltransferase